MRFKVLSIQQCWGERRMSYQDEKGSVRSVPLSWTDRKEPDMFVEQSAGRSIVHIEDVTGIRGLMESLWGKCGYRKDQA